MTDTVNHKANPILLTPDDLGVEFMTRKGTRVECSQRMHGYKCMKFSDGFWRHPNGRVFLGDEESPLDIVSRISEQVA